MIAAIVGSRIDSRSFGSSRRNCAWVESSPVTVRCASSSMSAPAEKALSPSPVMITASTSPLASMSRNAAMHCCRIGKLIALRRCGSLKRMTAMRSFVVTMIRSTCVCLSMIVFLQF